MEEIEGVKLIRHPDTARYLPRWETLLRHFARIQRDFIGRTDELFALGCPDWQLDALADAIDPLFEQLPTNHAAGMSEEEHTQLRKLPSRLKEMCAELAEDGLPPTLIHGDFHSGNIIANDQ